MVEMSNEVSSTSSEDRYNPFVESLRAYLAECGVVTPELFSSIKFPGGRKKNINQFIGWIPYEIRNGEIWVIVTPYHFDVSEGRMIKHLSDSSEDETYFQTIKREGGQEVGFVPKISDLKNIFYDEHPTEDHSKVFYASPIPAGQLHKIKKFNGYNNEDPEKGAPLFVPLKDAWHFLPPSHLKAARALVLEIRRAVSLADEVLYDGTSEAFHAYCRDILNSMNEKIQRREHETE